MGGQLRSCASWRERHDAPVYTLDDQCPDCQGDTRPAGPAPFSLPDEYAAHRRAMRRRDAS